MPRLIWREERLDCFILGRRILQRMFDEFRVVVHPEHRRTPAMVKACGGARSSITDLASIFLLTAKATCSRVYSSMMLQISIVLASQVESNWKSQATHRAGIARQEHLAGRGQWRIFVSCAVVRGGLLHARGDGRFLGTSHSPQRRRLSWRAGGPTGGDHARIYASTRAVARIYQAHWPSS